MIGLATECHCVDPSLIHKMAIHVTMRHLVIAVAIVFVSLTCSGHVINVASVSDSGNLLDLLTDESQQGHGEEDHQPANQHPIMPVTAPNNAVTAPVLSPNEGSEEDGDDGPVVSDVLPKTRVINIFASLTRDFEPIASRLNDASQNITVLAPRNAAIQALPRKPWEDPGEYEHFGAAAYQGPDGQDRAKKNLKRFVEAHLIPVSPWNEGEEAETLGGRKLKWMKEDDRIFVSLLFSPMITLLSINLS